MKFNAAIFFCRKERNPRTFGEAKISTDFSRTYAMEIKKPSFMAN